MDIPMRKAFVIMLVVATVGLGAAHAQSEAPIKRPGINDGPHVEFFVSTTDVDVRFLGKDSKGNVGLRGSYPITNRFAVEGSVTKFSNFDDVWTAELSAKFYAKAKGRTGVFLAAGPGMISGPNGTETLAHLGVGLEIQAGRHLYVRPEVRGHALTRDLSFNYVSGSLGLGWRF